MNGYNQRTEIKKKTNEIAAFLRYIHLTENNSIVSSL